MMLISVQKVHNTGQACLPGQASKQPSKLTPFGSRSPLSLKRGGLGVSSGLLALLPALVPMISAVQAQTFTEIISGLIGADDCFVAWGDYDNDGNLDILIVGHTGSTPITKIFRNEGTEYTDITFTATSLLRDPGNVAITLNEKPSAVIEVE